MSESSDAVAEAARIFNEFPHAVLRQAQWQATQHELGSLQRQFDAVKEMLRVASVTAGQSQTRISALEDELRAATGSIAGWKQRCLQAEAIVDAQRATAATP